jgi:hypothetical protein
MERNTKIMIGFGVLIVGGLATFFILRNKNKNKNKIKIDESGVVTPNPSKGTPLTMGYLQKGYVHIEGADRAKAKQLGLAEGSQVEIEGTNFDGVYTVTKVWLDSNKNVGAFKTDPQSTNPDGDTDRTYQKKAVIYLK